MMKHKLSILFFSLIVISSFAQNIPQAEPIDSDEPKDEKPILFENPKPAWKQNMHYGGNLWLGFFGAFYVDASPMIGYDVTGKGTIIGTGATLIYQGQYKASGALTYGGRLFVRQAVWRSIFAQAEYEMMNSQAFNFYNGSETDVAKRWGGSPLIGAGFYQGRTRQQKGSFVSVMYNLGAPSFGYISPQSLGGSQSPLLLRVGYFF